jgi:hypothetical protein
MSNECFIISAKTMLQELKAKLKDLNSLFPETQAFLKLHGRRHVDELTIEELKALANHLKQKYQSAVH